MLLDIEGFGAGCICYDRLVMHGFQFHKLEEYEAARIMSVHGALLFHLMTGYVDGDDIAQRRAYVGVLKELWPLSLPPMSVMPLCAISPMFFMLCLFGEWWIRQE